MELKYIWIKKYKNIKKIGFNIDYEGSEKFEYSNEELHISEKAFSPKGFFKKNIIGITAIVGKNGSGKTNLTEFINFNLAHFSNGSLSTYFKGIKGIIIIDKLILIQETLKVKNREALTQKGFVFYEYSNVPFDNSSVRSWFKMLENTYIYYSTAFEFRYINMNDNLTNISTSYLAFSDLYNSSKHYKGYETSYYLKQEVTDSLQAHYVNEKIRESDFILNYDINSLIFENPDTLIFSIDTPTENQMLVRVDYQDENKEIKNQLWTEIWEVENDFFRFLNYPNSYITQHPEKPEYEIVEFPKEFILSSFKKLFFINLFKTLLRYGKLYPVGFIQNFISINNFTIDKNFEINSNIEILSNKLDDIIKLFDWEFKKEELLKSEHYFDDPNKYQKSLLNLLRHLKLNLRDSESKKKFSDFVGFSKEVANKFLFFHYEFNTNYSSGQQNMLNFYSRFYWAKTDLLETEKDTYEYLRSSIVIFIDEGEVALHPEWQRTFFNKAVNFLSDLFHDRKIQLIITTHSPFVVSDLPKNNILFLERNENGSTKVTNVDRDKTFGANIYTLLSEAFFMENTIGEFAHEKIKWAIALLTETSKKLTEDTLKELRFTIDAVGEPIIKDQLEYLYQQKFGRDEVQELQQRVIELQKQLKGYNQ